MTGCGVMRFDLVFGTLLLLFSFCLLMLFVVCYGWFMYLLGLNLIVGFDYR